MHLHPRFATCTYRLDTWMFRGILRSNGIPRVWIHRNGFLPGGLGETPCVRIFAYTFIPSPMHMHISCPPRARREWAVNKSSRVSDTKFVNIHYHSKEKYPKPTTRVQPQSKYPVAHTPCNLLPKSLLCHCRACPSNQLDHMLLRHLERTGLNWTLETEHAVGIPRLACVPKTQCMTNLYNTESKSKRERVPEINSIKSGICQHIFGTTMLLLSSLNDFAMCVLMPSAVTTATSDTMVAVNIATKNCNCTFTSFWVRWADFLLNPRASHHLHRTVMLFVSGMSVWAHVQRWQIVLCNSKCYQNPEIWVPHDYQGWTKRWGWESGCETSSFDLPVWYTSTISFRDIWMVQVLLVCPPFQALRYHFVDESLSLDDI